MPADAIVAHIAPATTHAVDALVATHPIVLFYLL